MKIDLHRYELWEALDEIVLVLEECKIKGDSILELIHGFKQGQVLKNYIQSEGFIKEMAREGFNLTRSQTSNPGVSIFKLI